MASVAAGRQRLVETAPPAHAWFIGFRGSYAFAVLVEGGGVGGEVAAPLAGALLQRRPRANGSRLLPGPPEVRVEGRGEPEGSFAYPARN